MTTISITSRCGLPIIILFNFDLLAILRPSTTLWRCWTNTFTTCASLTWFSTFTRLGDWLLICEMIYPLNYRFTQLWMRCSLLEKSVKLVKLRYTCWPSSTYSYSCYVLWNMIWPHHLIDEFAHDKHQFRGRFFLCHHFNCDSLQVLKQLTMYNSLE